MLKTICNALPWSHDALRIVHQRPKSTTIPGPVAPKRNSDGPDGPRKPNMPLMLMSPREASSVNT